MPVAALNAGDDVGLPMDHFTRAAAEGVPEEPLQQCYVG